MLACFDASGHEADQPAVIVAGFVASSKAWDDFSVQWLARLAEDRLPYFHAASFRQSRDVFEGWNGEERRRQRLCRDLMDILASHTSRFFAEGVRPAELCRAMSREEQKSYRTNAYALCGRTCVADLGRWLKTWSGPVPELVFEAGDLGRGLLRERLVGDGHPEPTFRSGRKPQQTRMGQAEPFVPLQAADWLSYELFQLMKLDSVDRDTWRWPMRQFWQRFQGAPGFYAPENLEELTQKLAEDRLIRSDWRKVVMDSGPVNPN